MQRLNHVVYLNFPYQNKNLPARLPFQKYEIYFFFLCLFVVFFLFCLKAYFVPDICKFLYFTFLLPVVEIIEKVNEETILKIIPSSIVSEAVVRRCFVVVVKLFLKIS